MVHKTKEILIDGKEILIDEKIAGLVESLNEHGLETLSSCQGNEDDKIN